MGLSLKSVGNFLGNIFGGGDDEEEKRKRQAQAAQIVRPQNAPVQNQSQSQATVQQPDNGVNLALPNQTPNMPAGFPAMLQKSAPADNRNDTQKLLDQKTQENLAQAKKEREQGESWLGRNILNRGAINRDAEATARRRASASVAETNNYVPNADVQAFDTESRKKGEASVEALRKSQSRLDTFSRGAEKFGEIAQYVPVTGSIINLGLAGSEQLAKSRGNDAYANDISNTRNKIEFGLSPEEMAALPEDQRAKLQNIRNISYALSPLDIAGFGGLVKSEGVQAAKKATIQLVKQGAVDEATKAAVKQGVKATAKAAAVPSVVGAGVSAGGQQYLTGDVDPLAAIKSGLIVGSTSLLFPGRELTKTEPKIIKPDEVATGVESANPTREADAAAQQAAEVAKVEQAAAARQAQVAEKPGTTPTPSAEPDMLPAPGAIITPDAPVTPEVDATPAFQRNYGTPAPTQERDFALRQKYGQMIKERPDLAPQLRTRLAELLAQPMPKQVQGALPADVAPPVSSAVDAVNDAPVDTTVPDFAPPAPATAVQPELPAAPEVAPAPAPDVAPAVAPTPETPNPAALPTVPERPGESTVDVAPRTHDALVKQLGPRAQELKGQYGKRTKINLDDLKQDADGVVANMSDQDLVQSFSTADPATMVTSPESFAIARASLSKLSQSDDPAAAQTVKNLLDGMAQFESRSGQGLRIVQEEFDAMPIPMKVRYIIKKIDAANAENPNYTSLSDDPAKAAAVEANITAYLQKSQTINESISAIQGQLNAIAEAATRGERSDVKPRSLNSTLKEQQRNLEANNGELVKYYQEMMPTRSKGQRVNDFARRMMLASFTGRINDLVTTTANITNLAATNVTQGLLSKAVNFFKPGKVTDTLKGTRSFLEGTKQGIKKGGAEFGGTQYVGDVARNLNTNTDLRSGLQKTAGPVGRTIQAATEFATKASEGVRDQRLYQLADQEASQLGLDGPMRRQYAEARAAAPTRQMQEKADQLHLEINNLNENPVTRTLNRVSDAIGGETALGGFLKNQVMPFTSWLGGNIYNSVTDKNVVASSYKFIRDASRGDTEGAVRNLAKTINGAAQAYAIGYVLTESGVITNTDAEGYNDAGAYFHIGDRYIPVGFLGFFAPNIVLGNAAYNGLNNDDPNASTADNIASSFGNALANFAKSLNLSSALGVDNNLSRAWDAANREGGNFMDGVATLAGGALGQFVPGITGDINAAMNNGINVGGVQIVPDSLNPTHEKADTKVTKENPETGNQVRDYVGSAKASLQNRIPFASQQLPRKSDVAADDLGDRVTRGNRDTAGGKLAKTEAKTEKEQEADRKARGIPETEGAVEKQFQDGNFDKAIEGTKYRMSVADKKGELSKSDKEKYETDIRRMETMRGNKISYEDYAAYSKLTLEDWRNLGDPEKDSYDPDLYQKMYDLDEKFTKAKASDSSKGSDKAKFYAKDGKGKGGGESDATKTAKTNTVGSPSFMGKVNFNIPLQKAGSYKAPTIQQIRSSDLVKKRKISVSKG